jgi:hypothetical protein
MITGRLAVFMAEKTEHGTSATQTNVVLDWFEHSTRRVPPGSN